jgi:site-specific recombinase XerD
MAMNGASEYAIQALLRHKDPSMSKRYSHLSDSYVSGVVADMNDKIFGTSNGA